ncbi:MAG: sulfatase-like hydrolase/transferase [Vicinamibacterales bacterium]
MTSAKRRKAAPSGGRGGRAPRARSIGPARARGARLAGALVTVAIAAAAVWWLAFRAPAVEIRRTPDQNVLLITIDTLRADALGAYGGRARTPNLDALAARGVRYDFAHAHAVLTLPSHASILTGRYPFEHGIRDNSGYRLRAGERTLAGLLKQAGYATGAFIAAFPLDARFGLGEGFDLYDDRIPENLASADFVIAERPAGEVVTAATQWLAGQQGRWFSWVHVFDPHAAYTPPAPYDREYADSPYHGEVAYADRALGTLLDAVAAGSGRPTLVIVTSDHGEALGDHGELTHGLFAYESTLRVPLIVAQLPPAPTAVAFRSQVPRGEVSGVAARHVDLMPTVLDALGLEVPSDLPGRSLLGAGANDPERTSFFESMSASLNRGWAPLEGVLAGREKYISLPVPELYDLAADPAERVNLADRSHERLRALQARLRGFDAAAPAAQTAESADVLARLKALGYVSGTATRKVRYTEEDDPKQLVKLDQAVHHGVDLYQRGQPREAAAVYQRVIAERPDMAIAYRHLALLQWELGEPGAAIGTLRAAVDRGVTEAGVATQLGIYLAEAGQPGEALPLLEATVASRPADVEALNALGIARARTGQTARALQTFQRVLEIDRHNAMAYENMATVHLRQNDLAAARRALQAAAAINPRSTAVYTGLGVVALRAGDPASAIAHWKRAVDLHPANFDALFNLATELINSGQHDTARPYAEQFVRTAPSAFYGPEIERLTAFLRAR